MNGTRTIIPFNRPAVVGKEFDYIAQAVREGHAAGDGRFAVDCQRLLEATLGARRVFLTPWAAAHGVRLPFFSDLVGSDQEQVVDAVRGCSWSG